MRRARALSGRRTYGHRLGGRLGVFGALVLMISALLLAAGGGARPAAAQTDDQQATLTLVKVVVGGTAAPDDFGLTIDGNPVSSGSVNVVAPGDHVVAETQLGGYRAGPWGGDCTPEGRVTAAAGEHKTCVITNTFESAPVEPATLTIVKTVVGGTAAPDDFGLTVDGTVVLSGVATPIAPGDHRVAETQLDGYLAGPWGGDCAPDGTVIVLPGEHKTCTITNTFTEDTSTTSTTAAATTTTAADGGSPNELPRTGTEIPLPLLILGGFGVALLGLGLVTISARRP